MHDYKEFEAFKEGMSVGDICAILLAHRKFILIMPMCFLAVFLICTWIFVTPRYQAFATVEIGQLNGKLVEDSSVTEERMRDRSFIASVINDNRDLFKYEKDLAEEEVFLQRNLDVKKAKDANNLITFSLLGRSRDIAKQKAIAVFETLKKSHTGIFDANINMTKEQIKLIDEQIFLVNKNRFSARGDDALLNSYNAVVDALAKQDQVHQLRDLQNQKMILFAGLNSAVTYNTRLLGNVWVSQKPTWPDYEIVALISLFLGFVLTIFGIFLSHSIKK